MAFTLSRRALLAMVPALPLAARGAIAAVAPPEPVKQVLTAADGHAIPLWTWRTTGKRRAVIAFSHGAASAPWKYPDVIGPWVAAGYDVVAPLHVDSPDHPDHAKYPALTGWKARVEDMRAVSALIGGRYIAAGHSYGALTALVMGGASAMLPDGVTGPLRDPNAVCSVAFSPPPPITPLIEAAGYATLAVPALIETGTRDIIGPPGTVDGWKPHLTAYDAAQPGGHRYALLLEGADHYFGGLICDASKPGPPQTAQLAAAVQMSLAFMAAWGGPRLHPDALTKRLTDQGPVRLATK